jgi:Xaa-Pro dipeptidase
MGAGGERVRFVGHGIGLEVDEFPFLAAGQKFELQPGMTIALEPKLIFPGKGVVGIENTHVVTPDGLVSLSKYPDEIVTV